MTIEGFFLTHGYYSRAIDLLRERYGQHHKIIHATMQALLQLPSPSINIPSLRSFYDKMEIYIRGLESLSHKGTEWKFIPRRALWYGGWWERLIGMTKSVIKNVLGRSYLTLEELQTVYSKAEATMNDRPLTHVFCEPHESEAITPSHLLYGRRIVTLPYGEPLDTRVFPKSDSVTVERRCKFINHTIEQFQNLWKYE